MPDTPTARDVLDAQDTVRRPGMLQRAHAVTTHMTNPRTGRRPLVTRRRVASTCLAGVCALAVAATPAGAPLRAFAKEAPQAAVKAPLAVAGSIHNYVDPTPVFHLQCTVTAKYVDDGIQTLSTSCGSFDLDDDVLFGQIVVGGSYRFVTYRGVVTQVVRL